MVQEVKTGSGSHTQMKALRIPGMGAGGSCYLAIKSSLSAVLCSGGIILLVEKDSLLVSPVFVPKPILPYNQGKQPVKLWGLCCSLV